MMTKKIRNLHISREIRPTPPILLAGGGGWHREFVLGFRAFLAFRQLPGLAEGSPEPSMVDRIKLLLPVFGRC